ncbi:MAG: hypothetical protein NTW32_19930, partial [Chloroflexi bacterium]|nr:hypothetical protein [Chloroflexota bacterium]
SMRMQEYRYSVLITLAHFFELFGIRRPAHEVPVKAGDYNHALHIDHPEAPSLLEQYLLKPIADPDGTPPKTKNPD